MRASRSSCRTQSETGPRELAFAASPAVPPVAGARSAPMGGRSTVADTLIFEVRDGVGWIILNRPEARNAMNPEMREGYLAALARCGEDPDIRAVVLTGTGKGFCTGADLSGSRAATGATGPAHPGATRAAMPPSQRVIRPL